MAHSTPVSIAVDASVDAAADALVDSVLHLFDMPDDETKLLRRGVHTVNQLS